MEKPLNYTPLKKDLLAFEALLELDKKEKEMQTRQSYLHAYLFSVILAPIGIYYFVKYVLFTNGTKEDFKAGFICLGLTIITILLSIWLSSLIFQSINTVSPGSTEILKQLTIPGNQKELKDLFNWN